MPISGEEIYGAPWGRLTKILTGVAMGLLALPFVGTLALALARREFGAVIIVVLLIMLAVAFVIPYVLYRLSPRRYVIGSSQIKVERITGDIEIPLKDVFSAQLMDGQEIFAHSVRSNASGGIFGFFGLFSSPGVGCDFRAYATKIDGPLVLIKLRRGDPIVLSPDRPAEFMQRISDNLPEA